MQRVNSSSVSNHDCSTTCPQVARLKEKLEEEKRKNRELEEKLAQRNQMIEELTRKLKLFDNPHTPPSKKRFPSQEKEDDESQDENDDAEPEPEPDQPGLTTDDRPPKKPGRKKGHEGTTRPRPEPDTRLDVTESICPHCSSSLEEPTRVETRIIEDIADKGSIEVIEFQYLFSSGEAQFLS